MSINMLNSTLVTNYKLGRNYHHSAKITVSAAGKMFKSSDLPMVVHFFLMFHRDKPIDWLLDHLLYVKVCNPEKDSVSTLHCTVVLSLI